ncbi:hypothetical protein M378DRAFT_809868 [Amanita muscaria Koide BX008]|uniref:Uncharacterized protein n=1 Tax=Amanita muscaria (strain Koide BX008) TaxID=946122 RepID=A0A0C2WYM6_AMAMK|nr:hypothetical protein M378DRAFT_809868 [Amanita muscaria Koide BX008]
MKVKCIKVYLLARYDSQEIWGARDNYCALLYCRRDSQSCRHSPTPRRLHVRSLKHAIICTSRDSSTQSFVRPGIPTRNSLHNVDRRPQILVGFCLTGTIVPGHVSESGQTRTLTPLIGKKSGNQLSMSFETWSSRLDA